LPGELEKSESYERARLRDGPMCSIRPIGRARLGALGLMRTTWTKQKETVSHLHQSQVHKT